VPQFLIFDSEAIKDSRGQPVDMDLSSAGSFASSVRSLPVRLFGAQNVGFQFVYKTDLAQVGVAWCMEFFADNPSLQETPSARTWPGIPPLDPAWPWAREQIEEMASSGEIQHSGITRNVVMGVGSEVGPNVDARYYPMQAYGLWVRLAIWRTDTAPWVTGEDRRLYVFATEGGYDQETAAENSLVPWAG
jgi:hypothetical protein